VGTAASAPLLLLLVPLPPLLLLLLLAGSVLLLSVLLLLSSSCARYRSIRYLPAGSTVTAEDRQYTAVSIRIGVRDAC
jgi:hypothetical protein